MLRHHLARKTPVDYFHHLYYHTGPKLNTPLRPVKALEMVTAKDQIREHQSSWSASSFGLPSSMNGTPPQGRSFIAAPLVRLMVLLLSFGAVFVIHCYRYASEGKILDG
jgi:hypothetical protein